jgi:hypothetical protein
MQKHYEDLAELTVLIIKRGALPDTPIPPEYLGWTLSWHTKN